jgi:Repeat of unknown function (DUF346)
VLRKLSLLSAVIVVAVVAALPSTAGAHLGHAHDRDRPGDGLGPGGRIPGKPDVDRFRGEVHRFDAERRGYFIRRKPGEPEQFGHVDTGVGSPGGHVSLPLQEDAPICATSGHRVKVVYAYDPGTHSGAEMDAIRSAVRRMNWKLIQESQRSSGNTRTLQMKVDCVAPGEMTIHQLATDYIDGSVIRSQAESAFGAPTGANSVKYLIFRNDYHSSWAGLGFGYFANSVKSASDGAGANPNRFYTSSAIVYHGAPGAPDYWQTHVTLHEMVHSMGGSQYPSGNPAPFATPGAHCTDGIDILCYDDGTLPGYNENRCWANGYNDSPVGVPLDCGYDTYFDAGSQAGQWLHTNWNVGGAENPFLVEASPEPGVKSLAVTSSQAGRIDMFTRGVDDVIRYRWHTDASGWSTWTTIGTGAVSSPAASSWGSGRLDLYLRGTDGAIWHRWYTPSTGWVSWGSLGGTSDSGPGAMTRGVGRLDVFARAGGSIWHRWYTDATSWTSWGTLGGSFTSDPAAVSSASERMDLFARAGDGSIWHRWFTPGTGWVGWGSLGGSASGTPAVMTRGSGGLDVFVRGTDGALTHRWYSPSTGWAGWGSLGGVLASDPAAVSNGGGRIDVFAVGTDGALWRRTHDGVNWGNWRLAF